MLPASAFVDLLQTFNPTLMAFGRVGSGRILPFRWRAIAQNKGICSSAGAMIDSDLIIFDCDGVLVDSELLSCRCLAETLAEHGIMLEIDQALELFVGRNVAAVREHFRARGRTLPDDFPAKLAAAVRAAFR